MPTKVKAKSKTKKAASRRTARKAFKKKVIRKKAASKKKISKKKAAKKKTSKKAKKKTIKKTKPVRKPAVIAKPSMIEPGPPPRVIPPVEEPAPNEEAIGTITHYYSHLSVAVAQINKGTLRTGDSIHIKGHTTDITQTVDSMEFEHQHVEQVGAGQSVGIKVKDHVREHDIVYRVK
jgi:ATP-dependent 26S proteasome regulatory subunit